PAEGSAKPEAEEKAEADTPVQEPAAENSAEPEPEEQAEPETPAEETPAEGSAKPEAEEKAEADTPVQEPAAENSAEPEAGESVAPVEETPDAEEEAGPQVGQLTGNSAGPEAEEGSEPQAVDGEDAPQGPPAPDHESRTGGAGGNSDAEGEAEAAQRKTPATPLAKVKSHTPSLAAAYKAATTTLKKTDLTGTRAKLYLVLDRSASMRPYYKDGSVQALADQTLALAAHLDPEATVHVVFFSTEVDGTTDLTLTPDHETRIDDVHAGLGRMGRTSYHAAVEAVLTHYGKHHENGTPALVVFQTDGAPDAKTPATQALTEAAQTHPAVFFSFVAFGDHDNKAFDYARRLKTGNTSFFHAGPTPRELTDTDLYEGVLATWRP
ncbi:VWA domain-containing protein, partial [Streptomyces sp. NPDC007205]|uniref:VWA domain-containing protein n=1 Tax=Streptomyces sp. NPDC007205 TaxID=3154316 RepID=UPI0033F25131